MKLRRNKKGFTVVELVIVIAVIGVLAAVLIPTFINLTDKANKAADDSLVKNLNTALATQEGVPGDTKNNTLHDAVIELEEYGYKLPNLVTKSGENSLLWNRKTNRFLLAKDIAADKSANSTVDVDYFHIQDNIPEGQKYSVYAGNGFSESAPVNVGVGFDVGFKTFSEINYSHTEGDGQEVVIRTNGGTLTIDAVSDAVRHYGSAKLVDIQKVAPSSYHEHGEVLTAKIKQGRLVITEEANISVVKAVATDDEFTNIKLALVGNAELPTITRDAISIDSSTTEGTHTQLVLEVQKIASETTEPTTSNTEYVWASVTVNGSGEITDSSSVVASSKTELNESTKIVDEEISNSVVHTTLVHNAAELDAAVAAQAKYIMLANDISHAGPVQLTYSATIDGDGHKLTSTGGAANEQTDTVTTNWKFYHSVIEIQAANIDVKITNIDLINNRTSGTALGLVRTATNVNIVVENSYLSAKQYCVYTHVGSTYQNITLNYVSFDPTAYNAFYWRGANGKFVANNTNFTSTNTTSTPTNAFTTFCVERPLLINDEVFQSSRNEFIFTNCYFAKVQLGSNLQKLFLCGSENNIIRFNNTDFENTGLIAFGGKMTTDGNTVDMAPSHVFVDGKESMPLNSGYVNVSKSEVGDGRVYWPEGGFYSGTYSFNVSAVATIYTGYIIQNNGNGTWSIVPQE